VNDIRLSTFIKLDGQIDRAAKEAAENAATPPTLEQRLMHLREEYVAAMARDAVESDSPPTGTFWVVVNNWSVDEGDDGWLLSADFYWTSNPEIITGAMTVRQFDAEAVKAQQ